MRDRLALILTEAGEGQKDTFFSALANELEDFDMQVRFPTSLEDMMHVLQSNTRVCAVLFDWDHYPVELCHQIEALNENLPMFAFTNDHVINDVSFADLSALRLNFFEFRLQEVAGIGRKISLVVQEYLDYILPPLTRELFKFVGQSKYTFCTPGHLGGSAFLKSPTGAIFYDFYGANTFESDISISVTELGSLLDHTSLHAEAEKFIAKTFGADRSYIVTNGTSTANKIVGMNAVSAGDTMLMDRNCHKSLTHLMMMVDVTPLYFRPTRNAYGILGGIPKAEFTPAVIEQKMAQAGTDVPPRYAVVTNSTYDGLFYNTGYIKDSLQCEHIHFDSAWVPYTNFHAIYENRAGMSGGAIAGKTIYETQSTHKLLAAFSQASMIHIKGEVDEVAFNEPYMMHTSTSPQYNMVASCEVAGAMMKGNSGQRLMQGAIDRAINFRREIQKLNQEMDGWFFKVWQPDNIDAVACWPLESGASWHGFKDIDPEHMYLDPIKVTLLTPGLVDGVMQDEGIPADLVAKYLSDQDIVVEKTGPYSMLFLFSIGIDKSKSMKLLRGLVDFKRAYDANLSIEKMIPSLYQEDKAFYQHKCLQEVAQGVHQQIKHFDLPTLMYQAFDVLPEMALTPYQAFQQANRGKTQQVKLSELKGHICAHMILP
ncbi:MAG: lysine decarboxylase LdcC, partial [Pseudomonadales bacterium]|nr:lysine decarboxylase LdcC [Pseudomonadales bacterium]